MPTSNLTVNKNSAAHNSNVVWDGGQMFEEKKTYIDEVNILSADVARTAASGNVAIATTGVATFSASQAAILAAGDYFNVTRAGIDYKFTVVSGATTSWVVTPPPTTAFGVGNVTVVDDGATSTSTFVTAPGLIVGDTFMTSAGVTYTITAIVSTTVFTTTPDTAFAAGAWGMVYTPVNAGSYCDFPSPAMTGVSPIPEEFRIRFSGSGTLSATLKFVRVNARTGVETAITTAVATTAAALWQGVAASAGAQAPFACSVLKTGSDTEVNELPVDEFVRLVLTAVTTVTTGRTLNVEMGFRRKTGATNYATV